MSVKSIHRMRFPAFLMGLGLFLVCSTSSKALTTVETPMATETIAQRLEQGPIWPREEPFIRRGFPQEDRQHWHQLAIAYSPFRSGQAPWGPVPSRPELLEDLQLLQGHFRLLRVYGADALTETMLQVIREEKLPLQVFLGIWLEHELGDPETRAANRKATLEGIELANRYPEIVAAISVGNETQVYWAAHRMQEQALLPYLRCVRANCSQPVTTADDYNYWNKPESQAIAAEIDFLFLHAHPLLNGQSLDQAWTWLDAQLADIEARHPDREVVLGEIGWATRHNPRLIGDGLQGTLIKGETSPEAQERYLRDMGLWLRTHERLVFLFEAFDETWKGGGAVTGPEDVEKNWGLYDERRQPKPGVTALPGYPAGTTTHNSNPEGTKQ